MNFSSIFNDRQAVRFGEAKKGIHVHRMAVDVNGHDRARAWRDPALNLTDVHAPGSRIAIHQNRRTVPVENGEGAGDYRERWKDDLIARLKFKGIDRDLQGCSAVTDGDAVFAAAVSGPPLFEIINEPASRGNPSRADALHDVVRFALPEERLVDRYHG